MNESRSQSWSTAASWILRAAVLLHAIGFAVAVFSRMGTSWGGVALMEWGTPSLTIMYWEKFSAIALLVLAVTLMIRPTFLVALIIGLAVLSEAYAKYRFGGDHFVEWSIPSALLRFVVPLALLPMLGLLGPFPPHRVRAFLCMWILRVGLAIVFAVHGYQAIGHNPTFIDLLIGSSRTLLGYRLTESNATLMLFVIGIADFVVAAAILIGRWRPLLAWLCFWSTVTAFSRMTAIGVIAYPEVLLRASHILAPLAVWCLGAYLDGSRSTAVAHAEQKDATPEIVPVMNGDAARVS